MSRKDNSGFGCGELILLVIVLLAIWSLALGEPFWEWFTHK